MTFVTLRNLVARGLSRALGVPVTLSNQTEPEPDYPYIIYTPTSPYVPNGEMGDHVLQGEGEGLTDIRREQPTATISFTVCSMNREAESGYIHGDDEAQELADRAIGWFLHGGRAELSRGGVVVVDVLNAGDRSFIEIDEAVRQYGFDVVLRYCRADKYVTGETEQAVFKQKKG
ncbi:MAG: hypothetical protein HFG27_08555 [Provencibacterium sp.]|jgi:hypothetical protein|nr:hypothetical protein [Provencibacterium sp.]